MTWSHPLIGLLLASGFTLGLACEGPSSSVTQGSTSDTDAACPAGSVGSVGCACTGGGSCDPGLLCASSVCVDPDQGTSTTAATTGADPTTGDDTTGGPECDPGGGGAVDPACPAERPYCLAGDCVDCGALDCATASPSLPLCNPDTGLCAACLCDDATPVCDPSDHSCSKCDAHDDCPDSACDLDTGACLPAAATLWVGGGTCSDDGDGDKAVPLCGLDEAFARVQDGAAPSIALRVKAGDYAVAGSLRVPAGRVLALISGNSGLEINITSPKAPAIVVDPTAKLLLDGVKLVQSGGDGLSCAQGTMWLDRLVVQGAAKHGVASDGCTVTVRRSVLVGNTVAGMRIFDGSLRLENSFISGNGNYEVPGGGIYLGAGASLDVVYTTLIDNRAAAGNPYSIACDEDPGKESVKLRNSVAMNQGENTLCTGSLVATTAWTTADAQGASNLAVNFKDLGSYLADDAKIVGVYRAIPGSKLDDLAMWQDGDPRIDFDGDPRPSGDMSPDFAGADRAAR
mgnify:CR=1 FL=1